MRIEMDEAAQAALRFQYQSDHLRKRCRKMARRLHGLSKRLRRAIDRLDRQAGDH